MTSFKDLINNGLPKDKPIRVSHTVEFGLPGITNNDGIITVECHDGTIETFTMLTPIADALSFARQLRPLTREQRAEMVADYYTTFAGENK